ncbi:MAG TPA: hypothetical protein VGD11_00300 [Mycobacteriales bacterium]|jgi:hypothetical protein
MSATALDSQVRKLAIADRCDSCGAQAFVLTTMPSGHELLFCGHHFSKNEPVLASQGATVTVDERHTLNAKPSVSADTD